MMGRFGNWQWIRNWCKGEDVYVVASGPSLIGFPWDFLRGRRKVVISHVAADCPPEPGDCLVFLDSKVRRRLAQMVPSFYGASFKIAVGANTGLHPKGSVAVVPYSRELSLSPSKGFFSANSTGHFGLSLALAGGASQVYLLGHDCGDPWPSSKGHKGHNYYDTKQRKGYGSATVKTYENMARGYQVFETLASKITNLSPHSRIGTFAKKDWREHINEVQSIPGV